MRKICVIINKTMGNFHRTSIEFLINSCLVKLTALFRNISNFNFLLKYSEFLVLINGERVKSIEM